MSDTVVLSKLLHIRETEKVQAQKAYQQSMDCFEKSATQLYQLLKKKEVAEEIYEESLQQTTTLDKLKEQFTYLEKLNAMIVELQKDVQRARAEMEAKQSNLTEAHVETKKFEKIIERRKKQKNDANEKMEKAVMDEISMYQFLNYKNR
ncbi:flagellar export protein FliJ [Virgibacillus pantothenticus]|uniref:flagellar export protein FliJ n=1 Tax=Virgibacillus TaxID=84406 RepID=UPI00090A0D83|nr:MULTISPECIES: flagellar export protein FliJ [Virgibacillus]API93888.1 flagellar export protein FliJ [Virgibacillus sp. 6R]MBS7427569.1 flagellar export protein FliJ [Virgibacillus sp. 19R1-5]MBU8565941.1 flagellar export protein FliJ [Virgibacillus pantothenticus]MBU8600918.1 flagellar export protein FliJ [Virgibacillus pantothenticus]MBU8633079.1 flagellar export protein FliJ [Virgibacillus pantothenticus]